MIWVYAVCIVTQVRGFIIIKRQAVDLFVTETCLVTLDLMVKFLNFISL